MIQKFTSDGGEEYINYELKLFLEMNGIKFIPKHPYTPEENALVETLSSVLVNKMRAVMHAACLMCYDRKYFSMWWRLTI
ncbi:putative integrase catalytic domain-containing protein [Phytophthora infestans]|uniref:Putative integrase catalytic domain-containing protein n=1 Tax=Phytophthora infestans TaxID=4787 RepID=A0A8S9TRG2_PHYIN|nr:putative integrase catalytic domain-containing protein [Phytophthora infestans]